MVRARLPTFNKSVIYLSVFQGSRESQHRIVSSVVPSSYTYLHTTSTLDLQINSRKQSIAHKRCENLENVQSQSYSKDRHSLHNHFQNVPYLQGYHYYSTDHQSESLVRRSWNKIKVAVKTFMVGTKELYKDVKEMYEIRSKHGKCVITNSAPERIAEGKTDFPYSRQQLQFVHSTRKNLIKMLPTVTLFFIPFFGYFVPLVVFMYPQKLLSHHFWTDTQKVSFSVARSRESTIQFRTLMGEVRARVTEEQMDILSRLGKQLSDSDSDWADVHKQVQEKPFLPFEMKWISADQTKLLCKAWNINVWFPSDSKRQQVLEKHMQYLYTCDCLIALEGGVEKLTHQERLEGCLERNLSVVDTDDEPALKKQLETWVSLTTRFEECPVSLMAHLPMTQYLSDSRT